MKFCLEAQSLCPKTIFLKSGVVRSILLMVLKSVSDPRMKMRPSLYRGLKNELADCALQTTNKKIYAGM